MIHTRPNPRMPFGLSSEEDCYSMNNMMDFLGFPNNSLYQPMPASSQQSYLFPYHPGMKDVPGWLKTLRLHKYTPIFLEMTYEQMMNLTDQMLEQRKVTKGARGKILQSIEKLKKRPEQIKHQLENLGKATNPGCRCAIILLRQVLCTPIRPYIRSPLDNCMERVDGFCPLELISDENLPALLVHLLTRVHQTVFGNRTSNEVHDDYMAMLFKVYDLILGSEAFTDNQKRRVVQMKKKARTFHFPNDLRRVRTTLPHSGKCEACLQKEASMQNVFAAYEQHQRRAELEMQDFFNFNFLGTVPPRQQQPVQQPVQQARNVPVPALRDFMMPQQVPQQAPQPQPQQPQQLPRPIRPLNSVQTSSSTLFKNAQEYTPFGPRDVTGRENTNLNWINNCSQETTRFPEPVKQLIDPRISCIPQYRSTTSMQQPAAASSSKEEKDVFPTLSRENKLWHSFLDSDDLMGASFLLKDMKDMTVPPMEGTASLWSPVSGSSAGDSYSSSGYSSSTSERGSGAGSPRTRNDTQYNWNNLWSENYDRLMSDFTSGLKL